MLATLVVWLFRFVQLSFQVLTVIIFVDILLSWLPLPQLMRVKSFTMRVTDPIYAPIRRFLPATMGLDFSPAIAIILLGFLEKFVLNGLFRLLTVL